MNKKNHFKPAQVVRIDKLSEINYIIDTLNKRTSFHLYSTINNDTKVFLNKYITNLYGNIVDREIAIDILNDIESGLNYFVEKYKHFKKPFSNKELFDYVGIIKYTKDSNISLSKFIDEVNMNEIVEKNKYLKEPSPKNTRDYLKYLKEVGKHVI